MFVVLAWLPWSGALQAASLDGAPSADTPGVSEGPTGAGVPGVSEGPTGAEASASAGPSTTSPERVVVGEDDTLWDLARTHAPSGTHPTVYARTVMEVNDVDPQRLRPGEVVSLPRR